MTNTTTTLLPHYMSSMSKNMTAPASIRPTLAGVHITPTHIEATDSFMLIRTEYPSSPDVIPAEGIIVRSDMLKRAKITKKDIVELSYDQNNCTITKCNANWRQEVIDGTIQGKFPDIQKFLTKYTAPETIKATSRFDIDLMIRALTTLQDMGYEKAQVDLREVLDAIMITPYSTRRDELMYGRKTEVMIMPVKK